MTLERARELIHIQLGFGGGYNRNAVPLILGEVQHEHGCAAVDGLIAELGLEQRIGLAPGSDFTGVARRARPECNCEHCDFSDRDRLQSTAVILRLEQAPAHHGGGA